MSDIELLCLCINTLEIILETSRIRNEIIRQLSQCLPRATMILNAGGFHVIATRPCSALLCHLVDPVCYIFVKLLLPPYLSQFLKTVLFASLSFQNIHFELIFLILKNINVGLWDHSAVCVCVCVCVYVPLTTFECLYLSL
jgi:hypothetical protein